MQKNIAALFALFGGACTGTSLQFEYSIQQRSAAGVVSAAASCEDMGITAVRLMLGDDLNQNQTLEDDEIIEEETRDCNQRDDNGDGSLSAEELGLFTVVSFVPTDYELFAIELRDIEGQTPGYETFDSAASATRFSFGGGLSIQKRLKNVIQFAGSTEQLAGELQIFLDVP